MSDSIKSPEYMRSFQCLGGSCEDTCCQHWDIHLDKYHYDLLRERVEKHPREAKLVKQHIKLQDAQFTSDKNYAYIQLNKAGYCPFLTKKGFCHLHQKFDVTPLSDICAFFPRVLSKVNGVIELTGALSCPEVVRKCLFSTDEEQAFVDYPIAQLPRDEHIPITRQCHDIGDSFYHQHFLRVRDVMLGLLKNDDYALETRLYFLANFNYRIATHYHQHAAENNKILNSEIERIQSDATLKSLDSYYEQFNSAEPVAIVVIQAILRLQIQHANQDKLSKLATVIFDTYRAQMDHVDDLEVYGDNLPPEPLWQGFQQNWDKINARFGIQLENYLSRYLANCLQREWFISLPDPFVYIHMLTIRMAILRFLIVSHPEIINLTTSQQDKATVDNAFAEYVVQVIYLFARSIDHNLAFLQVIYEAINEQQMMSFDYSMPFIKF